jgi:hypothetical protein
MAYRKRDSMMTIARREALLGMGAAGAAVALGGGRAAAGATGLDLATPQGRLAAYIMVRGALDDRLVTSWVSARYYGIVGAEMRPLFNVRSAVFARYRPAAGGGYDAINAEIAWFTDPDTGRALTAWTNPYTGQEVKVPGGGYAPSRVIIRPDLGFELGKPVPGLDFTHEVLPYEVRGDDLYITERARTALRFPGAAQPFRYSESNTFHTKLSALNAPGAKQVTSEVSFTNVCSWRPWMDMGAREGHLMATGIGRQGATRASIPAEWVAATSAMRPEVLKDPAALLAPLWDVK